MKKELSFVYIAADGKKFTNEIDAIEYEKKNLTFKGMLKKPINRNSSFIK